MLVVCLDYIWNGSTLLYARFEILLAVLKIQDLWDMAQLRLVIVTDVSQDIPASIFTLFLDRLDHEVGGNKLSWNIGSYLPIETIVLPEYLGSSYFHTVRQTAVLTYFRRGGATQ